MKNVKIKIFRIGPTIYPSKEFGLKYILYKLKKESLKLR
jgi:hypothetical protein